MKISVVLGTRPEIIKMSSFILECPKNGVPVALTHTSQHYSYNMGKIFFDGLDMVHRKYGLPVLFPLHPQTKKHIDELMPHIPSSVRFIEPLGYFDFLQAQSSARLALTDSGGVQEEMCVLGVPCVTLRDSTERQETVEVGSNILAGTVPEKILKCVDVMMNRKTSWASPLGDGTAGKKILEHILNTL